MCLLTLVYDIMVGIVICVQWLRVNLQPALPVQAWAATRKRMVR